MYDELWAYLEADLAGADAPPAQERRIADPKQLLDRVAELTTNEWSEREAASELSRLANADCLRAAHTTVLGELLRNPCVDIRGIRIARILLAALGEHQVPLPARAEEVRRSGPLTRLFRGR